MFVEQPLASLGCAKNTRYELDVPSSIIKRQEDLFELRKEAMVGSEGENTRLNLVNQQNSQGSALQ